MDGLDYESPQERRHRDFQRPSVVSVSVTNELTSSRAMKPRVLLGCLAVFLLIALVVFLFRLASRGPELPVGSTLKDPWAYFTAKVQSKSHSAFRETMCGSPLIDQSQGMVVNFVTQFSYAPRHPVALRTFSYQFDTNGTLVRVTSHWKFPILDF